MVTQQLQGKSILIFDIETNSLDVDVAKMKWFGAYSYLYDKSYQIPYTDTARIRQLLMEHKHIVGFNIMEYDLPILEKNLKTMFFKNKVDLLQICRQRLPTMGIKVKDYSLDTIIRELKLDKDGKGEIDYTIFEKDSWTLEEEEVIKTYLKQDVKITQELFEYFNSIFSSIAEMLSEDDRERLVYIKSSPASLSYRAILNKAGIKYEFADDKDKRERETFEGAHHIEPRWNQISGNIVSIDFTSMYPHCILMCNMLTQKECGWNGNNWISLKGAYDNQSEGKIETALNHILLERLEAKKNKDKAKNMGYKVLINSFYGTLGNNCFKTTYNPVAAGDCTHLARTILKRLAATLEANGFQVLYGFTDNVIIKIPEESSVEELMVVAENFINQVKSSLPFPKNSFKLELDKEMKFICFFAKNCYLYLTKDDKIEYTSTLLNKNTPEVVIKLFNEYISPKIKSQLAVDFTEKELQDQLLKNLEESPEKAAEEFNSQPLTHYKVKTSLEYQITEKYGVGKHYLIPNIANIGVGKATKYCSIEEFKEANLNASNIHLKRLVQYLKPFYKNVATWDYNQTQLNAPNGTNKEVINGLSKS